MEFNDQSKLHRFLAKWLIRLKFIKQIPADLGQANEDIKPQLPVNFAISIPGGSGELTLGDALLRVDEQTDRVTADLLCEFKVVVANQTIYKAYIKIVLEGMVDYDKAEKTISPTQVRVRSTRLISDDRSMIKDTRELLINILPEPIKTVFISTFVMTDAVLKRVRVNELARYLSLYLGGSQQRILDYHHTELESTIIDYLNSGALDYSLDEAIFEEQLFAEYGEKIAIRNGEVLFIFHD